MVAHAEKKIEQARDYQTECETYLKFLASPEHQQNYKKASLRCAREAHLQAGWARLLFGIRVARRALRFCFRLGRAPFTT